MRNRGGDRILIDAGPRALNHLPRETYERVRMHPLLQVIKAVSSTAR